MLFYQTAENIGQPGTGMKKSAMGVAGSRPFLYIGSYSVKPCFVYQ